MQKSKGFTLIELLVVIAIIAVLTSVVMPALRSSKRRAQAVICRSNLKQWALVFALYANDNDGSFPQGYKGNGVPQEDAWMLGATLPYYEELDMRRCPATKGPDENFPTSDPIRGGTYEDWGIFSETLDKDQWWDSYATGSYGFNNWCVDVPAGVWWWGLDHDNAIRKIYDKRSYIIPLVLDSVYVDTAPLATDKAPSNQEHEMDEYVASWEYNSMKFYSIDRHSGGINGAFVDMHVQHVGIKQLWRLKWHNNFNTTVRPAFESWLDSYKDY